MDNSSEFLEDSIESTVGTGKCRICWRTAHLPDLISPCVCSGSQLYTHFECLQRWIQERDSPNKDICDVCQHPYQQIVIRQTTKGFGQWFREGEDVLAKIFTTLVIMLFFIYIINMGCIQFVISEHKINVIIRFIQLALIIFFSTVFFTIFLVSIYVFKSEYNDWQKSHMNIIVERIDGSINSRSSASSLISHQSSTDFSGLSDDGPNDQSRHLIVNDSNHNYGSV